MNKIGGNITAEVQTCTVRRNEIGERVREWQTVATVRGWLDYQSGDSKHQTYDSKVQESTHVFVCDYAELGVRTDSARLLIDGAPYEILLIDDPMGMRCQLEIFLKRVGADV